MRHPLVRSIIYPLICLAIITSGCRGDADRLILATTTSTYDSGLLDEIIPDFESTYQTHVDIIAVGTGQAITLGENGDADLLLVHDREKEQAFVAAGFGLKRIPVMYNDFIIVGPSEDPAGILGMETAAAAFRRIAEIEAIFVSRGDDSGTFAKEQSIWEDAGIEVNASLEWYLSIGQGMGETLQFSNQNRAYTLSDRGTFLSLEGQLTDLRVMVGGGSIEANPDPGLRNEYSVIVVLTGGIDERKLELSRAFVDWLIDSKTQDKIGNFSKLGQPLFRPVYGTGGS